MSLQVHPQNLFSALLIMKSAIGFVCVLAILEGDIAPDPYEIIEVVLTAKRIVLPKYSPRARELAHLSFRVLLETQLSATIGLEVANWPHRRCISMYGIKGNFVGKSNEEIEMLGVNDLANKFALQSTKLLSPLSAMLRVPLLEVISKMNYGGLTLWKDISGVLNIIFYFYEIPPKKFRFAYQNLSKLVLPAIELPGYDEMAYIMAAEYTAKRALLYVLKEIDEEPGVEYARGDGFYIHAVVEASDEASAQEAGIEKLGVMISSETLNLQNADRSVTGKICPRVLLPLAKKGAGLNVLKLRPEGTKYIIAIRFEFG